MLVLYWPLLKPQTLSCPQHHISRSIPLLWFSVTLLNWKCSILVISNHCLLFSLVFGNNLPFNFQFLSMNEAQIEITIPHLFRCPISLDLFEDPVTLCTGQTYDRSSIEKWFSAGNLTCPVTMQKLHDPSIVTNHTLRHLINQRDRKSVV